MPRRVVVSVGGIIHISGNIFKRQYSRELYWWKYIGGIIMVEIYSRGNLRGILYWWKYIQGVMFSLSIKNTRKQDNQRSIQNDYLPDYWSFESIVISKYANTTVKYQRINFSFA